VKNLRDLEGDATGDSADAAFEADRGAVSAQLAQLDSRELSQFERALARSKLGKYGICEHCQKNIIVARLNALPSATLCIACERVMEMDPGWQTWSGKVNWGQIIDWETATAAQQRSLSEVEMSLSIKS